MPSGMQGRRREERDHFSLGMKEGEERPFLFGDGVEIGGREGGEMDGAELFGDEGGRRETISLWGWG